MVVFDYRRAIKLQKILSSKVISSVTSSSRIDCDQIRFVAGLDAAYHKGVTYGVAVLIDLRTRSLIKHSIVSKKTTIPYVPGLLAFREAPSCIAALLKLGHKPDLIVVDGHGLTHPRGLGIASHVGLVLDTPSIGVAKKRLYGEERNEDGETYIYVHGVKAGKIIVHRGRKLYVSIGYRIRLDDAVRIIESLLDPKYKLPLPTALADMISKRAAHRRK